MARIVTRILVFFCFLEIFFFGFLEVFALESADTFFATRFFFGAACAPPFFFAGAFAAGAEEEVFAVEAAFFTVPVFGAAVLPSAVFLTVPAAVCLAAGREAGVPEGRAVCVPPEVGAGRFGAVGCAFGRTGCAGELPDTGTVFRTRGA